MVCLVCIINLMSVVFDVVEIIHFVLWQSIKFKCQLLLSISAAHQIYNVYNYYIELYDDQFL